MATELNIPNEHINRFSNFIKLSDDTKKQIFVGLDNVNAEIELNPRLLTESIYSSISSGIEKDKIFEIVQIYLNLINTKNSLDVTIEDFLPILEKALVKSNVLELGSNEKIISDFKTLLLSGRKIATKSKIVDLMTEKACVFLDAKLYQDIRPSFDENGEIIGSAIINNLKLIVRDNQKTNELYIALDNNDLNKLQIEIKKAQESVKFIKTTFKNANIIEP